MASPLGDPSREATPSSTSSQGMSNDFQSSYSASASSSQGPQPPEDVDRFLKRMDMEKKLQALQQRLELASVKATNGWTDMSIGEIEDKLPMPPARRRSFQPVPGINLEAVASSSRIPYEPPSPARPWQLMDVLWQPLPPPSRGPMSPGSPVSPSVQRRRSKRDEIRFEEGVGALSNGVGGGPALPGGHHLPVHRRASSAAMMAYLSHDPYPVHSGGRIRKEKRSQSHSHTTTQDVDAAKALTAMLGGGGSSNGNNATPFMPGTPPRHRSASVQRRAPSTAPPRPSRRSESTTREYDPADRLRVDAAAANRHEDEDTDAAELMMFLAHSPSAAGTRRYSPSSDSASSSSMGGAARVLFADGPHDPPKQQPPAVGSSNLALAPPITAGSLLSGSED